MIKKVSVLLALLTSALTIYPQGHQIDFNIKGLTDTTVLVGYHLSGQKYAHDTLEVNKGKFSLSGPEPMHAGLYFVYTPSYYLEFLVKDQQFKITANKEGGYQQVEVEGSPENRVFREFQLDAVELQREILESEKDSTTDSLSMIKKRQELERKMTEVRAEIIRNYEGTFAADFLRLMEEPEVPEFEEIEDEQERREKKYRYFRAHYFDNINFLEPGLLRTPILESRVIRYFDKFIPQHPDTINAEIDKVLQVVKIDSELLRYWLVTFFQKYQNSNIMGMDAVTIHLIEKYYLKEDLDWVSEESLKKLREEVAFVKPNLIGKQAPPLNLLDTMLQPYFMEQIQEPFVVLYFYDPDCGFCKKKTPVLRDLYPELKDLGAEVVAICTTTDVEKWKKYIREYNLEWINLSDPRSETRFKVNYNVRSTPKLYVLDEQRKIIAKQLDVEMLVDFLKHQ